MIQPWKRLGSEPAGDFKIFKLRKDRRLSPRTGREHEFIILDCPDWVNVIAVTPDDHVVMVEQFRHGSDTVELEIPGGMMDPGETDPVAAGLRELREETGYAGQNARLLAEVWANPALQTNRTYTVMVEQCTPAHETQWDQGEDMVTRLVPAQEIAALLASGRIRHPLVHVALSRFVLLRQRGDASAPTLSV